MNAEIIKQGLFPIYKELLSSKDFENVSTFCLQWGEVFPFESKSGVLFVGKAVNGWVSGDTNVD